MVEVEQGTPEWHTLRCGVITASRFKDACGRLKATKTEPGAPNAKCLTYAADVALERVTGMPAMGPYVTMEMRIGTEREPYARQGYEARTQAWVSEAGIALTDDGLFGYSTDGLVEEDGLVEIKCPSAADVIVSMWRDHDLSDYMHQIQGGLWLTGRKWIDFVMFVPGLKAVGKDLYVRRVLRDEAFIEVMEPQLLEFKAMVEKNEAALRAEAKTEDGRVIV